MQASQERFGPVSRFVCLSQHEDLSGVFEVSSADISQIVVQMVRSPVTAAGKDDQTSLYSLAEGQVQKSATLAKYSFLLLRMSGK